MSYTLTYFNGRGRAELVRFVFAQAGVEYEDKRVTGEEFGAMKKDLPTGSLPVLDFDGKRLSGSVPMAFYVAEKNGLAGSTAEDRAFISAILDLLGDLQAKMFAAFFGSEEDAKAKAKKALEEEHMPRFLKNLENNFLAKNDSPDGWVYGNNVTIADLAMCLLLDQFFQKEPALGESYPKVKKCIDAVKALPRIAEWIKKRPETPF